MLRHHVAVHGAAAGGFDRVPLQRLARGAHRPCGLPQRLATRAALNQQLVVADPVPEELGVGADRRRQSRRHQPLALNRNTRNRWRPEHFTVLVGVGRQPRDEMAGAKRGLLLVGDVLELLRHRDDVAKARIAFDLELRVRRDDAGESGVFDERRRIAPHLHWHASAFGDAFDLGGGHRPRLEHDRWRDDAAEPGLLGEFWIEVDGVHIVERVCPVPNHRLVHRIRCDGRLV